MHNAARWVNGGGDMTEILAPAAVVIGRPRTDPLVLDRLLSPRNKCTRGRTVQSVDARTGVRSARCCVEHVLGGAV